MLSRIQKVREWFREVTRKEHDMRPYADAIVKQALKNLKEKPDDGKPLVLLIGEAHSAPAHKIIQMLVLKQLKEKGINIAFGIEGEHNMLPQRFSEITNRTISEEEADYIKFRDPDGILTLKTDIGFRHYSEADLSRKILNRFALTHKISTRFNDAAKNQEGDLNDQDSLNRQIIQDILPHKTENVIIPTNKAEGIHVRNHIMVQNALKHAKDTQAQIYIQHCGAFHLMGCQIKGYEDIPYQQSLSPLFQKEGCSVFNVPLANWSFYQKIIPSDAPPLTHEVMQHLEPPQDKFRYESDNNEERIRERSWLKKALSASALDPTLCDFENDPDNYGYDIAKNFKELTHALNIKPRKNEKAPSTPPTHKL